MWAGIVALLVLSMRVANLIDLHGAALDAIDA